MTDALPAPTVTFFPVEALRSARKALLARRYDDVQALIGAYRAWRRRVGGTAPMVPVYVPDYYAESLRHPVSGDVLATLILRCARGRLSPLQRYAIIDWMAPAGE